MNSQNAVITCEWRAIPLPRNLLNGFLPMMRRATTTAGVNGPNLSPFPMVHFAGVGRRADTAGVMYDGRMVAPDFTGVGEMKAGFMMGERYGVCESIDSGCNCEGWDIDKRWDDDGGWEE